MQSVPIKPKPRQIKALVSGLILLCVLMLLFPPLCAPLALVLPLLCCLLEGKKAEPAAWMACAMPTVSSLLAGYDELYAFSLLTAGVTAMLITRLVPPVKRAGLKGVVWYTSGVALSATLIAAAAVHMLGGPLWKAIPALMIHTIESSDKAGLLLYQMGVSGFLRMPEGYASSNALMHVFEPAFVHQMSLSLRLTLETAFFDLVPAALVQASLIVGLFTALRVQRFGGMILLVETKNPSNKKTHVAIPPGFSLVTLPNSARWPVLGMAAAALFLLTSGSTFSQTLGTMCFTVFETVYTLIGAAVFIWVFASKNPDRKTLFGVIAALLYVMAPFVLFLIGLTDQTFHYRSKPSGHPDQP